jgi:hypothetical protein
MGVRFVTLATTRNIPRREEAKAKGRPWDHTLADKTMSTWWISQAALTCCLDYKQI